MNILPTKVKDFFIRDDRHVNKLTLGILFLTASVSALKTCEQTKIINNLHKDRTGQVESRPSQKEAGLKPRLEDG